MSSADFADKLEEQLIDRDPALSEQEDDKAVEIEEMLLPNPEAKLLANGDDRMSP